MDLQSRSKNAVLLALPLLFAGCVAPKTPVPTFWQKLGIPQAGARLRDGIVNRQGNNPQLEKKPPVLALADPANLEESKPEMIKAAAKIKQDQDLKKQKIKAIKFLAEVNCGCYDQDGEVEAAFLEALEDCDPDVRTAAIEGLDKTAGKTCGRCNPCCPNCNTRKIHAKLQDIAHGVENGCYIEPVKEIRKAAHALLCKCPPPAEDPIDPEELIPPEPIKSGSGGGIYLEGGPEDEVTFNLSDNGIVRGASFAQSSRKIGRGSIVNPDAMVTANVVGHKSALGEIVLMMPGKYKLQEAWQVVLVDASSNQAKGEILEVGGRRVLIGLDSESALTSRDGDEIKIGAIKTN